MNIASSSSLSGASYLFHPQTSQNGVSTNFAFAEPLSPHSRMILSGQMDSGSGTFWRFRDTFNYRPDNNHDYRVSVGYGRMNVNDPGNGSIPVPAPVHGIRTAENRECKRLLSDWKGIPSSWISLPSNTDSTTRVCIIGTSKSFINPSIQIVITPAEGWSIRTSLTSRRANDSNTVVLPDGETLNLSEPTLITMVGNQVEHESDPAFRDCGREEDHAGNGP